MENDINCEFRIQESLGHRPRRSFGWPMGEAESRFAHDVRCTVDGRQIFALCLEYEDY